MDWKGKINFETRPQLTGSNIILTEKVGEINAVTAKATPADADVLLIEDSAASFAKKKVTVSSIKGVGVNDEGTPVTGTPHNTLNFIGDQITATNAGGGVANITIVKRPIVQIVRKNVSTSTSGSPTIAETSTPTSTSGTALDSQAITLSSASNIVRVQCRIACSTDNDSGVPTILLHRGTTVLAVWASSMKKDFASFVDGEFYEVPGSVGPHTYSIRYGSRNGDTIYINQTKATTTPYGGTLFANGSWLTLTEIAA